MMISELILLLRLEQGDTEFTEKEEGKLATLGKAGYIFQGFDDKWLMRQKTTVRIAAVLELI